MLFREKINIFFFNSIDAKVTTGSYIVLEIQFFLKKNILY